MQTYFIQYQRVRTKTHLFNIISMGESYTVLNVLE